MNTADAAFRRTFSRHPDGVWMAPGRVNLIGEHTDYNDGFVLPIALPRTISVAAARRSDGVLRFVSQQAGQRLETHLEALAPETVGGWAAHPAGVIWALREAGHPLDGFDILIDGTVPVGAGLSSSAALACATALAITDLQGIALERSAIARVAQRAENAFVGVPCGILDQSAALLSSAGHVLFLDTRSLRTHQIPLDLGAHGLALFVINTNAPHRLVDGEYAARRRTCERAADLLGVTALRDIESEQLSTSLSALPDETTQRRVRHVVTENERVRRVVQLLRDDSVADIGAVLTESHASMRDDYDITVAEVDLAVEAALAGGALGARMTGGGFGGCVVALVPAPEVDTCSAAVRDAFAAGNFITPEIFQVAACDGARRLDLGSTSTGAEQSATETSRPRF